MPPKKKAEEAIIHCATVNVLWTQVELTSDMTEEVMTEAIWFWALCWDLVTSCLDWHVTANAQLTWEADALEQTNKKLNYNIEVQTMLLQDIKQHIWDKKYKELRATLLESDEFKKLTDRNWL